MNELNNPYATALDGLVLEDPVKAFFDFCRERERIRSARASGQKPPWTQDVVLQQGRFLNVFREDDRVTKSVLRFVEGARDSMERLVHAALFARWCNKDTTLDGLSAEMLDSPDTLKSTLERLEDQPWCNVTAYPVEPLLQNGRRISRLDTATRLFFEERGLLLQAIRSGEGDISGATKAVNRHLGMNNDFPIFMAIVDLAWFVPDLVNPSSHVPTGIGAVAYLDRLQNHLGLDSHAATCDAMIELQKTHWPEAKRAFEPIDVEYLSCECRKYYSYVNGTKSFTGKNVFKPGRSPKLLFDIPKIATPSPRTETMVHVIAGAPCSGKTTLLKALAKRGHRVERETAEVLLEAATERGESAESVRADPIPWQEELLRRDFDLFDGLAPDELVFTDTSFIETLVFSHRAGLEEGPKLNHWLLNRRYKRVFFLEALEQYEQSTVRIETDSVAQRISHEVQALYAHYGYDLIRVPAGTIEERLAFIEEHTRG